MNLTAEILLLMGSVALGVIALLLVLHRQRVDQEKTTRENPYAVSTEGEKRCPNCGMGNLWTDDRCITCGAKLPG